MPALRNAYKNEYETEQLHAKQDLKAKKRKIANLGFIQPTSGGVRRLETVPWHTFHFLNNN